MAENLTLTTDDGHTLTAYRARPEGAPRGGVVVVQEIFGVNDHIREVSDGYAAAGYLAVAPAIFDRRERGIELGYGPEDIARGRDIRAQIDMDDVIRDVAAAADCATEAGRVGIVGYCWGGLIVYVACCRLGARLVCGSGYYGANILSYIDETPAVPVMLHFGDLDESIPLDQVEKIRAAHPEVVVHVYEGADHGFNCDRRKQYNAAAAGQARTRTLDLFARHIG